jgi:hypothetical protein
MKRERQILFGGGSLTGKVEKFFVRLVMSFEKKVECLLTFLQKINRGANLYAKYCYCSLSRYSVRIIKIFDFNTHQTKATIHNQKESINCSTIDYTGKSGFISKKAPAFE